MPAGVVGFSEAAFSALRAPTMIWIICADDDRYAFSIPLPCDVPKKIEALRGQSMKASARDEIKSTFPDVKGKVQEKPGQLANGPDCLPEGQKTAAKVQRGIAKTAEVHGEFAPDLGKE